MIKSGKIYIIAALLAGLLVVGYVTAYVFLVVPEPWTEVPAPQVAPKSAARYSPQAAARETAIPRGPPAPASLAAQISALGKGFDGDVGISVRSVETGWTASHNGAKAMPQQSVSKLWVAAAVLDAVDAGTLRLSDTITLTPADLTIFHQPIRKRIGGGAYQAPLSELLNFAMTQSDNTANDALFRKIGGKAGVEDFLNRKGLSGIKMSAGEKELQMQIAGMQWNDRFSYGRIFWQVRETVPFDRRVRAITAYAENPADGAAADSIAGGLAKLQQGALLSPASSAYLLDLMNQSKTGPDRLRGGLSGGWTIAHKTGTGQVLKQLATAYNDVGILKSPSGKHYGVAVMIASTNRSVPDRQALMHAVMQAVIACETAGEC
jgi:beta-lactamase class A